MPNSQELQGLVQEVAQKLQDLAAKDLRDARALGVAEGAEFSHRALEQRHRARIVALPGRRQTAGQVGLAKR